ncbi:hypothetical protein KSC_003680 [Ktedonobacter sp. SOSP1-52]|nr:hypothetical protein KSC_003680 [Ktedonobacter sp. SOSP1-52]
MSQQVGIFSGERKDKEMIGVRKHHRPQGPVHHIELSQGLGGQDQEGASFAQFAQDRTVIDGVIPELVDQKQKDVALRRREGQLPGERRGKESQDRGPNERGDILADVPTGSIDEQDLAPFHNATNINGGGRLPK